MRYVFLEYNPLTADYRLVGDSNVAVVKNEDFFYPQAIDCNYDEDDGALSKAIPERVLNTIPAEYLGVFPIVEAPPPAAKEEDEDSIFALRLQKLTTPMDAFAAAGARAVQGSNGNCEKGEFGDTDSIDDILDMCGGNDDGPSNGESGKETKREDKGKGKAKDPLVPLPIQPPRMIFNFFGPPQYIFDPRDPTPATIQQAVNDPRNYVCNFPGVWTYNAPPEEEVARYNWEHNVEDADAEAEAGPSGTWGSNEEEEREEEEMEDEEMEEEEMEEEEMEEEEM